MVQDLLVVESLALNYKHPHKHVDKEPDEWPASKVDQHPETGAKRVRPAGRKGMEAGRQWHTRTHMAVHASMHTHVILPGVQPHNGCGSLIQFQSCLGQACRVLRLVFGAPKYNSVDVVADCCQTSNLQT